MPITAYSVATGLVNRRSYTVGGVCAAVRLHTTATPTGFVHLLLVLRAVSCVVSVPAGTIFYAVLLLADAWIAGDSPLTAACIRLLRLSIDLGEDHHGRNRSGCGTAVPLRNSFFPFSQSVAWLRIRFCDWLDGRV
eukprot:SAG11_NODE_2504_length_3274_cov_5.227888_2_plen_136_part_00